MKDFSTPYRGQTYFGITCEERADDYGQTDAWNLLVNALLRTMYEDVRDDDLESALVYLRRFATRDRPFQDFRDALGIADPFQRSMSARDAAHRIRKAISSP